MAEGLAGNIAVFIVFIVEIGDGNRGLAVLPGVIAGSPADSPAIRSAVHGDTHYPSDKQKTVEMIRGSGWRDIQHRTKVRC